MRDPLLKKLREKVIDFICLRQIYFKMNNKNILRMESCILI
jgi:hypothetical protein